MFIDKVTIKIASGRGGHGANTIRQEKFVAFGGPDGGDGGRGGSVYLEASTDLSTLLDFQYRSKFQADDGSKGARKNQTGKSGEDLVIKLPLGTVVKDTKLGITIADLCEEGQKVLVAEGGRGGRGNARFKSNRLKVPDFSEPGEPGIQRDLELELKMIADVGIIGFPNAGKSTLISNMSAAKPKIADYAFTTIKPNLGVVRKKDGDAFVMADIPGLIDGASEGQGLGHQFLRHIERTRLLVHMIDLWGFEGSNVDQWQAKNHENPLNNFIQVNYELYNYSPDLAQRKQIIVLNKAEAYPEDELEKIKKEFYEHCGYGDPDNQFLDLFAISAVTGQGIPELQNFIEKTLIELPQEDQEIEVDHDPVARDHDDSEFSIDREELEDESTKWNVHCGKLERHMKLVDLRSLDSLNHIFKVTKGLGVIAAIKRQGAQEGDTLNIDGVDFEITDAVLL